MSILSLQTASPNLKNDCFILEILTFLKNSRFCIGRLVWELFGTLFGSFWVVLGVLCGVSGALRSTKSGLEIRVGIVIHLTYILPRRF